MYEGIFFAGFGGQGIILAGKIVCLAAMGEGKHVSHPLVRSGNARRHGELLRRRLRRRDCLAPRAAAERLRGHEQALPAEVPIHRNRGAS